MSLIYIAEKFPLFFCPKPKFWLKKDANFFAWEEDMQYDIGGL